MARAHVGWFSAVCALWANTALAQSDPPGLDFVTVGSPNNPAYDGPDPFGLVAGRGSTSYEYRLSRTEVTTSVWLDFFNAALARPDPLPFTNSGWWASPARWGATRDTSYTGPGTRYRLRTDVANAGMLPVGGISWRQAAVLCNYLDHDRNASAASFMSGAYDVSTFSGDFPDFTDQREHSPGSRFWIPTLDEWMKGVHFDPNGSGPGQHRWWLQPNRSDTPLVWGPPPSFGGDGTGQANSGFSLPGNAQYNIPLGSYPTVQTPWGLLDAAGATGEWLESTRTVGTVTARGRDGSYWTDQNFGADWAYSWGQGSPSDLGPDLGLRLASSIPAPSSALTLLVACGAYARLRRRNSVCTRESGRISPSFSWRSASPPHPR